MDKRTFVIKKSEAGANRLALTKEEKAWIKDVLLKVSDCAVDALYEYRVTYETDCAADFCKTVQRMKKAAPDFSVTQYLWIAVTQVVFLTQRFYEKKGLSVLASHDLTVELRNLLREKAPFFEGAEDETALMQTFGDYLSLKRGAEERRTFLGAEDAAAASRILAFQPELPYLLLQARQPFNRATGEWEGEKPLLTLLHFSDVHGGKQNLADIVELGKALPYDVNDILFTGDAVRTYHDNGKAYWDEVSGAEQVLPCMGNHDLVKSQLFDWNDLVPMEQAAREFFETQTVLQGENVTYQAGTTYYRKEYPKEGVLLITLDTFLRGEELNGEFEFFKESLQIAEEKKLAVAIAQHDFPEDLELIPCNFCTPYRKIQELCGPGLQECFKTELQRFIEEGGEFMVFLCGHSHMPLIGFDPRFPDQRYVILGASSSVYGTRGGDSLRVAGTQSANLANFVTFDTKMHLVKLIRAGVTVNALLSSAKTMVMNYRTGEILTQN